MNGELDDAKGEFVIWRIFWVNFRGIKVEEFCAVIFDSYWVILYPPKIVERKIFEVLHFWKKLFWLARFEKNANVLALSIYFV